MTSQVRTRFAPSPTGYLHIGGVRTALFSWLYARRHRGIFILRIEDTDRERSTPEAIQVILDGMQWLGLPWEEGPFFQTKRMDRYREVLETLVQNGKAYRCYCSREELDAMRAAAMARGEKPKYNGRCRERTTPAPDGVAPVIRFRNPLQGEVRVDDRIQGPVVYQNVELDDLVLARADGTPTYNFSVVVDDLDMAITHVIRGDDHLNNTPRQINIFNALGVNPPSYAHLPLILAADGKKLSKRHGTVSVLQYRADGYLPQALLNYLVRLGWSHGDQEIFSLDEMAQLFDISDVNKSAAAINPEKLLWLNQQYLRAADDGKLASLLVPFLAEMGLDPGRGPDLKDLVAVQKLRTSTLREMAAQSRYFFEEFSAYEPAAAAKHLQPAIRDAVIAVQNRLKDLNDWADRPIQETLEQAAADLGVKLGKIAQPLRVAVTGSSVSPSIDQTLRLLGRARVLSRLERALAHIGNPVSPQET